MSVSRVWCVIVVVITSCTCGARTECGKTAQISFLTSVHDDPSCTKLSTKGVMLYEAANLFVENYNNRTDDEYKIDITVLDTCGSVTGALKAVMKALVLTDINCLHPPHYLGIIGPNIVTNIEAIHKVTSILQIPHIVKKSSISPYLHPLAEESNSYIAEGILNVIETLKWKSFTLVANINDENDDAQNIAKKLTISATARNICVIVHNNDEKDYTSHTQYIVHIGKPEKRFFNEIKNATIIISSEGNLKDYLNRVNSTNTMLLLEDSRNAIDGLEWRVENSQWWTSENSIGKYNAEQLRQIRWLEDAVRIYARALTALCKNNKCKSQINLTDWNHIISNVIAIQNAESRAAPRFLDLFMKTKTDSLKYLGGAIVREDRVKVYWGKSKLYEDKRNDEQEMENRHETRDDNNEDMPYALRELLLSRETESKTGCATTVKEIKMPREKDNETTQILVSGMNDSEWWTVVCTVSGLVGAMFLVGIFGVYVIYTNIRGPRYPKSKDHLDRDTSLRSVASVDRELSATVTPRNQRTLRTPQRTGSDRSYVSEKSV